jgi:zinc transport system substrate-binding protein
MKKFKIISCLLLISILTLTTGCRKDNMEDIDIMVTNYPTEYILTELYGEHANIKSVYPDGVVVKNYKISKKRKKDISEEELFVYTGLVNRESKLAVELLDLNNNLKIIDTSYILEIENSE